MALGSLVGRGFIRIDADTAPAKKAIMALGAIGAQGGVLALGGAIAPVTTAVMALASSFAVAGGAAAAFGAAVVPQFQDISKAMQQQSVAEDAKTKAAVNASIAQDIAKQSGFKYGQQVKITSKMTAEARDKAKEYNAALSASDAASKSAKQSQALYKQELDGMPPATRETTNALIKLKDSATEWSRSLSGSTMPIFTKGIQFLTGLLPKLTPIVKSVAGEISMFVYTLGQGQAGKVFREFGDNVSKNGASAFGSLLRVIKNLIVGFVGLLNAFMPMSKGMSGGLEDLTAKFANFGATLGSSSGFKSFIDYSKKAGPELAATFSSLARAFGEVATAAGPLGGVSLTLLKIFADLVDAIPAPALRLLVPAIIAVNLGMKLYAIYTAAAAAATWLFSTATGASRVQIAYQNTLLVIMWVRMKAIAIATRIAAAAQLIWQLAMTAAGRQLALQIIQITAVRAALVVQTVALRVAAAATWLYTTALRAGRAAMAFFRVATLLTVGAMRALAVAMFTNPFGLILVGIMLLVGAFILAWKKSETFRTIVRGALNGVVEVGKAIGRFFSGPFVDFFTKTIPAAFRATLDWVKTHWPWILGAITGPVGLAVVWVIKHWDGIKQGASRALNAVINFFKSLPGRIISAIGSFNDLLYRKGNQLIMGFWNGNKAAYNNLVAWIRTRAVAIRDALGNVTRVLLAKGREILTGFWNGNKAAFTNLIAWMRQRPGVLRDALGGLARFLLNKGREFITSFWNGCKITFASLVNWTRQRPGVIRNALGGLTGTLRSRGRDIISGFLNGLKEKWADAIGWVRGIKDRVVGAIKKAFGIKSPSRVMMGLGFNIMAGLMKGILSGSGVLKSAVKGIFHSVTDIFSNGGSLAVDLIGDLGKMIGLGKGGNVGRWGPTVIQALRMLGQPVGFEGLVMKRLAQESGGNPSIVNKWDSNWQRGTPSVGLMQVIGPTFRAYAGRFRNTGPFLYGTSINPLANIYAGLNYALHRYGSLNALARPGGYDSGGLARGLGMMPKYTIAPERVLSPRQTAAFEHLVGTLTSGGGAGVSVYNITLDNHGVIGSRHEVENWLVESLDQLRRKGRIK